MALQKFLTYLKTDPVLLTLFGPVIAEFIMPMKYFCFFPKSSYEKGEKGITPYFRRKPLENQTSYFLSYFSEEEWHESLFPENFLHVSYLECIWQCGMLPRQQPGLMTEVPDGQEKWSVLCFMLSGNAYHTLAIYWKASFSHLFIHLQYQNYILKSIFKCSEIKKSLENFFNTYSNPFFFRQVKTQDLLCFKVLETAKELKHISWEEKSDFDP